SDAFDRSQAPGGKCDNKSGNLTSSQANEDACKLESENVQSDLRSVRTRDAFGYTTMGIGAVVGLAGVYFLLTDPAPEAERTASRGPRFGASASPGRGFVTLSGS